MVSRATLLALVALVTLGSATDPCRRAFNMCDFKFRGYSGVPTFDIWFDPNESFTTKVVSKNRYERLGVLNSNGIEAEFINSDGTIVKMSEEKASPRFKKTHFKPFYIRGQNGSGIGHQTLRGNQQDTAAGRCIRVFFSMYQVLTGDKPPFSKENRNAKRSDYKCVVLRTV